MIEGAKRAWAQFAEARFAPREELPNPTEDKQEFYRKGVRQTAYRFSMIALAVKLFETDGEVNARELHKLGEMAGGASTASVQSLLLQVKDDPADELHYARKITRYFPENRAVYREALDNLFSLAQSDGPLHVHEILYLHEIAKIFELDGHYFTTKVKASMLPHKTSAAQLLGVSKSATVEEKKHAYRMALQACHPDKFPVRKDLEPIVEVANARVKLLSEAYAAIT